MSSAGAKLTIITGGSQSKRESGATRWTVSFAADRAEISSGPDVIDLNTANTETLEAVLERQGHGYEIVRYRGERGRFDAVRQFAEVPGLAGKWSGAENSLRV